MFTGRLWVSFGLACACAALMALFALGDPLGAVQFGVGTVVFFAVSFLVLVVLSFAQRAELQNAGLQVLLFVGCFALTGPVSALVGVAVSPLFGLPATRLWSWEPYLNALPALGLTVFAVAVVQLVALFRSRRLLRR